MEAATLYWVRTRNFIGPQKTRYCGNVNPKESILGDQILRPESETPSWTRDFGLRDIGDGINSTS
jgi:hypothetical protein